MVPEVIRFLLFKEDLTKHKHKVVESSDTIQMVMIVTPLATLVAIIFFAHMFIRYGFLGFLMAYLGVCIAVVEIPHCIKDW